MTIRFGVAPMKAVLGPLPSPAEEFDADGAARWAFEVKWDGHRTIAHVRRDGVRLQTSAGHDSSARWPEVVGLGDALNAAEAVLDGEMLVIGDDGRASFDLVQRRDPDRHRAVFHVFDVLEIDGTETISLGYLDRRRLLDGLVEAGPSWLVPSFQLGGGADLLAATAANGLEGVVAKRTDSAYQPGKRSPSWRKIKNRRRVVLPIGGFTRGEGARSSTFGSLLVGRPVAERLEFAGGVGTGFDQATLERLAALLSARATRHCPFDPPPPSSVTRNATWVEPGLAAEIEIAEFTNDGLVRHASFVELVDGG